MIIPPTTIHISQQHIPRSISSLVRDTVSVVTLRKLTKAPICDVVGYTTGYETIQTQKNCGGYCDSKNMIIAFNGKPNMHTVFHEIAHALQAKDERFCKADRLLSVELNIEWQAETIAYMLYSRLLNRDVSHELFNSYFNKEHVLFLKNWYKGWVDYDECDIKLI